MYNLWNASRASLVGRNTENERKQRNSIDRHSLRPLLDDYGTDEKRYYRSSEFQRALLEDQIQQSFTPSPTVEPAPEENQRLSRYSLKRRSTAASKSSLSLGMLDMTREVPEDRRSEEREEREQRGGEPEIPSSPYASIVPIEHKASESTTSDQSSEPEPEPAPKHRVPRIHLSGVGPLLSRVRSRRTE
ncbi:hypothetical protein Slin15195_G084940 [Septoria linicola]|uniref:Uncharacterized protein n=1 Tax=Septoria linicola TaxID=215465 RepID=A0A9Q9AU42_9PEZI|nr:hypothetical protein Slin14017_G087500 [Septoria linicola]USW55175.1 hypothetical protein Slin15195_G084940 [Septoria linicola]